MTGIRDALQGYKTYIVAALLVLTAILGWLNGAPVFDTIDQILVALGLGTLRAGIKTDTGTA